MATGYKRNSKGQFNGGYGKGALGGKGAYAGRKPRAASARPSKQSGKKPGVLARARRNNQIRGVAKVAVGAGLIAAAPAVKSPIVGGFATGVGVVKIVNGASLAGTRNKVRNPAGSGLR